MGEGDHPGLDITELEVTAKNGLRRVVVATPVGRTRPGRSRLEQMRGGDLGSRLDDELLKAITTPKREVHAIIFRATGAKPGDSWRLGDDLTEEEDVEIAYHFVRSHVAFFREIVEVGVFLLIGVDFATRELAAYARGTERLASELEKQLLGEDKAAAKQARLDLWLAERQAYWRSTPYQLYVDMRLADALVAAERQFKRLKKMLAET